MQHQANGPQRPPAKPETPVEIDMVDKLLRAFRQHQNAGLIGETWTFKVGRSNGGRIRIFHDGECPME